MEKGLQAIFKASIFGYSWRSRAIVFIVSVVFAVGSFGLGYLLDLKLGTGRKVYAAVFLLVSFPLAQILIHKLIIPKKNVSPTEPK